MQNKDVVNMTNEEFIKIVEICKELKGKSNVDLTNAMNDLTKTFNNTKIKIIDLTHYLDNIEEMYHKILSEYNSRVKNG